MLVDDLPAVEPDVDYKQILPIQQKRTIAFVNHFVMNTVSYLNSFAQSCESRFMEFEYKLQKVEASLLILESQLSSIDGLNRNNESIDSLKIKNDNTDVNSLEVALPEISNSTHTDTNDNKTECVTQEGIKISDVPQYKRFFKMLQFGVPVLAVKLKMQNEGVDPNILDEPNKIISEEILAIEK